MDAHNYEDDDVEAVVYCATMAGFWGALFVMARGDAVRFCSDKRTRGRGRGGDWIYMFTTHRQDWRETPEIFRRDDGRFDGLLNDLGIKPIYRGGFTMPPPQLRLVISPKVSCYEQLTLFDALSASA